MDIADIGILRFTPTFNENDKATPPMVVKFRTLRDKWPPEMMMLADRINEVSVGDDATREQSAEAAEKMQRINADFSAGFLKDHIVGVEGLTKGAEKADVGDLLALLKDVGPLASELVQHISRSGQFTEADGKN